LEYLLQVMRDETVDTPLRVRAAVAAAQYCHVKRDDGGKKEERQANAVEVAKGKLAPAAPPKLSVVK
jgi:phage terminase small subunit